MIVRSLHRNNARVAAAMSAVPGWGSWTFEPLVLAALVLAGGAVCARLPPRRRSGSDAVGAGHWVPYAAGLTVVAVALCSPLDAIGDGYLLSAHMAQHVLLSDIAPALLVLGLRRPLLPLGLSRRALLAIAPGGGRFGRVLARLTSPWVAIPAWAIATWVWAIPACSTSPPNTRRCTPSSTPRCSTPASRCGG